MKTKIVKSVLKITLVILLVVAWMQLYRANMELQYKCESLEWRMENKTEQLDVVDATLWRRVLAHGPESSKAAH